MQATFTLQSRVAKVMSKYTFTEGPRTVAAKRAKYRDEDGPKQSMRPKPARDPMKMKTKPGPGHYETASTKSKIAYSIKGPSNSISGYDAKKTPGPGTYNDDRELYYRTIAGSKMGLDTRKGEFFKTNAHGKPDPGKYEIMGFTRS